LPKRGELQEVRSRLKLMGDPRAARLEKAAVRSPHRFHGIVPPLVRAVARQIVRAHRGDRDLSSVFDLAGGLWNSPWHEERGLAIQVVAAFGRRLGHDHWPLLKDWVRGVRCADHGDGIAVELLGRLVKRDRSWCRVLKHWTLSKSIWERRAAVMATLLRVRHMGDAEAALQICETLMRDRAPQVQEAVGVVLREAQASDPALTREFLDRWRAKARPAILAAVP
jgi:3-methyladenine DNA glycosylase AlkD